MRLPILYALAYPERVAVTEKETLTFDLTALSQLDFSIPDLNRFPCLRLAYEAAEAGGKACIALNAADEIAVAAFLAGDIPFLGIPSTIEAVLQLTSGQSPASILEVLEADLAARESAREVIARQSAGVRR
jgi:1-deoxy-D-xylulose-5-phosphate reductoisomerase